MWVFFHNHFSTKVELCVGDRQRPKKAAPFLIAKAEKVMEFLLLSTNIYIPFPEIIQQIIIPMTRLVFKSIV